MMRTAILVDSFSEAVLFLFFVGKILGLGENFVFDCISPTNLKSSVGQVKYRNLATLCK